MRSRALIMKTSGVEAVSGSRKQAKLLSRQVRDCVRIWRHEKDRLLLRQTIHSLIRQIEAKHLSCVKCYTK